jgi:hypothetical protein
LVHITTVIVTVLVVVVVVVNNTINNTHNWKAPGSNGIQYYWYKKLASIHPYPYKKKWLKNPECLPDFLTIATTYLLAIEKATTDPF